MTTDMQTVQAVLTERLADPELAKKIAEEIESRTRDLDARLALPTQHQLELIIAGTTGTYSLQDLRGYIRYLASVADRLVNPVH